MPQLIRFLYCRLQLGKIFNSCDYIPYIPIICISASDSNRSPEVHKSQYSWPYIQGAGDDEESWCKGLTPEIMWKNIDSLLTATSPEECQTKCYTIVNGHDRDFCILDEEIEFKALALTGIGMYEGNNVESARMRLHTTVRLFILWSLEACYMHTHPRIYVQPCCRPEIGSR